MDTMDTMDTMDIVTNFATLPLEIRCEILSHLPPQQWSPWLPYIPDDSIPLLVGLSRYDIQTMFIDLQLDIRVMKIIMDKCPWIDPGAQKSQVLVIAVIRERADIIPLLLSHPRINPCCNNCYALRIACERGYLEAAKLLLADGRSDPNVCRSMPFRRACGYGHLEIAQLLLTYNIDYAAANNGALIDAVSSGHTEVVRLLLSLPNINPCVRGNYALILACVYEYVDIVRILLANRSTFLPPGVQSPYPALDPSIYDSEVFVRACRGGRIEVVQLLLDDGRININAQKGQALRWAIANGHAEVVALLISRGASLP